MPKFIVHSVVTYSLMKVVEVDDESQVDTYIQNNVTEGEYQKYEGETVLSISPAPNDYDLHDDANSKGYF